MSCCAPKIGLARFAEHPGVILFAYLCALLPLAGIYALDFITKDWKSVRDTRRGGQLYLWFSLPPLAVVVFYIHLQRLDEDYKEMATAITAAILCILHVSRTVWGLLQLRAFKEWNMHALQVLVRMGFDAPIYVSRDEAEIISDYDGHLARSVRRWLLESQYPLQKKSLTNILSNWLSKFVRSVRELLGLDKPKKVSVRDRYFRDGRGPSAKHIERTIDLHMMVNNSLVDNEFSGAELPCRLNFPRTGGRAADFLNCRKPEECAVRWTVSFLARFGSEWLIGATQPAARKKSGRLGRDVSKRENLTNRLAAFVACIVTHDVDIESECGEASLESGDTSSESEEASSQQVSILSPLHVMCSDLVQPWVPILKVTDKNCLPFQLRGGSQPKEVHFENHNISIQNYLSAWPNESRNELNGKEKDAVLNMSAHQVAWFSKLIEEQDANMLEIREKFFARDLLTIFFWQIGYECESFEVDDCTFQVILNNVFCSTPVPKESLECDVDFDYDMLQASVHVDNWLALQAGNFPVTSDDVQYELAEAEVLQYGQVFSLQKKLELRRLQLKVASENGQDMRALGKIKFLGCVMEIVRSSLAKELGSDLTSLDDWSLRIAKESCTVVCSDQLHSALQEADVGKAEKVDTTVDALQMRVLWETQLALLSSARKGRSSSASMMLCMLGYPSLRISKIDKCPPVYPSVERNTTEDVSITVEGTSETDERRSDPTESVVCREEKLSCLRIDIAEAPQPLHITFQWTSKSNKATVQIGVNEDHAVTRFCWQMWKDGFMGRLCAKSNWRSTRLQRTNEKIRKEATASELTSSLLESTRGRNTLRYWSGWPPFLSMITQFEKEAVYGNGNAYIMSISELDEELGRFSGVQPDEISDSRGNETKINASSPEPECDCRCEGHELFLKAKELLNNGKKEEALKLFLDCIVHHKHILALGQYVSTVINKPVRYEDPGKLVRAMREALERTSTENTDIKCRKFKQYDLESVIGLFGDTFEKSGNDRALYWKAKAMLLWSTDEYSADERCIEAFESLVLEEDVPSYLLGMSRSYLAMWFFLRYCSTGNQSDEEVGIQHCIRLSDEEVSARCVGIAFLIEKGSVSLREYKRIISFVQSDQENIVKKIFLRSSSIEHRMPKKTNAAFTMYSRVVAKGKKISWGDGPYGMASNRLALMYYQRSTDGGALPRAEALVTAEAMWKEIRLGRDTHNIHAICNLGVLYGQRNGSENSEQYFKDAIGQYEEKEVRFREKRAILAPLQKHSSSMSNLAVITESGDIEEAKTLYRRAVEIDENPIAKYNLAVLLKFGDSSGESKEEAEELFSAVANLGVDLQSMPVLAMQLETARMLDVIVPSTVFPVAVEEIDDCLAYVKIIDSAACRGPFQYLHRRRESRISTLRRT